MKEFIIKGKNSEEKFKSVERTLGQLARKSNKAVGVYTPPMMLSAYIEKSVDGMLHKQMFPLSGKLTTLCVLVEKLPEKKANVDIEVVISYPQNKMEKLYFAGRKRVEIQRIDKRFPAGTRIEIRLNGDLECSGIWLAGTFEIDVNKTKLSTIIVEELEQVYDRLQEDVSSGSGANKKAKSSDKLTELIEAIEPKAGSAGDGAVPADSKSSK